MTKAGELLPCPFCGSQSNSASHASSYVMCFGCDADGPIAKPGQNAVELWNKRAAPAEDVREVVEEPVPFQYRVKPWITECFGPEISGDQQERNHRFLEEALELVQACGATASEAHQLVDYVYGRPVGDKIQEIGGVMVTLAALCLAHGLNMHLAGEAELQRIWTKVDQIR